MYCYKIISLFKPIFKILHYYISDTGVLLVSALTDILVYKSSLLRTRLINIRGCLYTV